MSGPLSAAYFADQAVQQTVEIVENVRLARDTYRVRFHSPQIARRIVPGQFLMLRLAGMNDPLIGRPLALYDTVLSDSGQPAAVDVVYLVKGKLTSRLYQMQPGQRLDVWGPLGNGFEGSGFGVQGSEEAKQTPNAIGDPAEGLQEPRHSGVSTAYSVLRTQYATPPQQASPVSHGPPTPNSHLIMVAGGIGQTPFLALAQEALGLKQYGDPPRVTSKAVRVTLCYGARTAEYVAINDFQKYCSDIRLATDDGSRGHHGLVTDLLKQVLAERWGAPRIVCCGPEPMMEAVAHIAQEAHVPCQVSLETPMACGVGICFTCVAKIRQEGGGWDYKRTCVEGPVFDANLVEW